MPRTRVRTAGQESASLQALVPWCSSCNGLMGRRGMCIGEANYFIYYKRLEVIAKLATSYIHGRGRTKSQVGPHMPAMLALGPPIVVEAKHLRGHAELFGDKRHHDLWRGREVRRHKP